jgi:nucleoside-diphosphate-sugar epimerase
VRSIPSAPARVVMRALTAAGLAPFAPYHWLLYGESLYFDTSRARAELDWVPRSSNAAMLIESYEWYLAHRDDEAETDRSHHQLPVRPGLVRLLKYVP